MYFDIHAHLYKYPWPYPYESDPKGYRTIFPTEEQLVEMHDSQNIERAVLLPLVNSEVYVPQSVGEVIEIANNSNGRFIPFCNIDPRVLTNTSDAPLGLLLEFYKKQGCKGIGEVLPSMDFLDPKMQNLMRFSEMFELPLLFDLSAIKGYNYGIYDDPGLPQLEKCLEQFPNRILIGHGPGFWSEIGVLLKEEDRISYPSYPVYEEGSVARLMRDYPNLWVDLSAGSGYNALSRDVDYAVKFLNEFGDRALFGTDICFYRDKSLLPAFLERLLNEGKLPNNIFENIAHKNAERLLNL